jgi:hypothetical protein
MLMLAVGALKLAPSAAASPLANRCKLLKTRGFATRVFLKPTGLGT